MEHNEFNFNKNKSDNLSSDEDEIFEEFEGKRLNLPKKSKYRMRAHCNPLAEISIS
jgi:hypothetical protein